MRNAHLSWGNDSFLKAHTTVLEYDVVIVDFAVVGEASHWGNALLREIVLFSRGVVLNDL
jgi:hypothetical protein